MATRGPQDDFYKSQLLFCKLNWLFMDFCTQKGETSSATVKTKDLEVFFDAHEETELSDAVVFR